MTTEGEIAAEQPQVSPRQLAVTALLVTLLAALFRLPGSAGLAADHFDEGAYVLAAEAVKSGTAPEGFLAHQHFLSPPAFFGLAGYLARVLGIDAERALFALSLLFGILTTPLVLLLGTAWNGFRAGVVASVLVAVSDFHVLFSRTALTDVAFCFWFLLGLLVFRHAERRRSPWFAALAGLVTGIAWNTKYHGWFLLLVAASDVLSRFRRSNPDRFAAIGRLMIAGLVAALCYLPWFLYVSEQEGGYRRLTTEHARFLADWKHGLRHLGSHVAQHLRIQAESQGVISTWVGAGATGVVFVVAFAVARARATPLPELMISALLAVMSSLVIPGIPIVVFAVTAVLVCVFRKGYEWRSFFAADIAFVLLFAVSTPLYHPYARLLLPFSVGCMLLGGRFLAGSDVGTCAPGLRRLRSYGALILALIFSQLLGFCRFPVRFVPEPKDALPRAADVIARKLESSLPIAVLGEPSLVSALRSRGRSAIHLDHPEDLSARFAPGTEIVLVEGIYARRAKEWAKWQEASLPGDLPLARHSSSAGLMRRLDDFRPKAARDRPIPDPAYEFVLWRLTVPAR